MMNNNICDVYIKEKALHDAVERAKKASPNETIGFMVGRVRKYGGKIYAVAERSITSEDDSSATHTRFKIESLGKIAAQIKNNEIIVGWYHSHPGYGCFMSERDLKTQREMFIEEYHTALVIDPVNNQIAFYKLKTGGFIDAEHDYSGSDYTEAAYKIFRDDDEKQR